MVSLLLPRGGCLSRLVLSQLSCPVPLPFCGVLCCSMWVLRPLVQVCPSRVLLRVILCSVPVCPPSVGPIPFVLFYF